MRPSRTSHGSASRPSAAPCLKQAASAVALASLSLLGSCSADEATPMGGRALLQVSHSGVMLADVGTTALQGRDAASDTRERSGSQSHGGLSRSSDEGRRDQAQQHPASFFGAFSSGESTYDVDGETPPGDKDLTAGWAPSVESFFPTLSRPYTMPGRWFEESPSAGPKAAWQTYYPSLDDRRPRGIDNPPWRHGRGSARYQQKYQTERIAYQFEKTGYKPGYWFDASVSMYDAFGRNREPSRLSERRYLEWAERSAEASFACDTPGCMANTTLQLFNESEQAAMCKLSVSVYATDFDDEYSREVVEWLTVNGRIIQARCDPKTKGCSAGKEDLLYPCVSEFNLEGFVEADGKLELAGKISPMVDECPTKDGNLLSGRATVKCFVRPHPAYAAIDGGVNESSADNDNATDGVRQMTTRFRCRTPGCVAEAEFTGLTIEDTVNRTCKLKVSIQQTDFDGEVGSNEEVEWVKIGRLNGTMLLGEHIQPEPGRNPCHEQLRGGSNANESALIALGNESANSSQSSDSDDDLTYVLVDDEDVTEDVQKGVVKLAVKISDMVDECGSRGGYLLDGDAVITCK